MNKHEFIKMEILLTHCFSSPSHQKLRNAGIEIPEVGKKITGPQEENKNLKEEVKTLKAELDNTKKGKGGGGREEEVKR